CRGGRHTRRYEGGRICDPAGGAVHGEEGRKDDGCRWACRHGERLGQAVQLGGLYGGAGWGAAGRGDLRSSVESTASHLLACAGLWPVRIESVRTAGVRSEAGGE